MFRSSVFFKTMTATTIFALFAVMCSGSDLSEVIPGPEGSIAVDVRKAVEFSLNNIEDIKISEVETEITYHQYREAQTLRYPELTGRGEWKNNARYPVNLRYPRGTISDYEMGMGVTLSQTIWSSGRVSLAVESARRNFEMVKLKEDVTREDVIYTAKVAYHTAILAKRALKIARESYENSIRTREALASRSAMGRASRKDNIRIESDIAARMPEVAGYEADVATAKNILKRIMGIDPRVDITLSEDFRATYSEKKYDDLVALLLEREPMLKVLEKNILLRESLIRKEKAEYLPYISGFFTWDYWGRSDEAKHWYIGQERLMDQFGAIGLSVTVPIFDMGRTRERVKQAQKDREKALLEFERTSRNLVLDLKNAVSDYNKYIEMLKANRRSVELSEQTFSLFQDLFKTGQVTLLEINDAELALTREKLEEVNTLYNINTSFARIERLVSEGEGL